MGGQELAYLGLRQWSQMASLCLQYLIHMGIILGANDSVVLVQETVFLRHLFLPASIGRAVAEVVLGANELADLLTVLRFHGRH